MVLGSFDVKTSVYLCLKDQSESVKTITSTEKLNEPLCLISAGNPQKAVRLLKSLTVDLEWL